MIQTYSKEYVTEWTKDQARTILVECDALEESIVVLRKKAHKVLTPPKPKRGNILYGKFTKKTD